MTDQPPAHGCTVNGQPAMPVLLSEYQQLTADLAALRDIARGYCPACGRGDAAPTLADWERERRRAEKAEQQLAAITDYASTRGVISIDRIRHILQQPAGHDSGPSVAECAKDDAKHWPERQGAGE